MRQIRRLVIYVPNGLIDNATPIIIAGATPTTVLWIKRFGTVGQTATERKQMEEEILEFNKQLEQRIGERTVELRQSRKSPCLRKAKQSIRGQRVENG